MVYYYIKAKLLDQQSVTDLNASQHLLPLASTTLKADGKSGKYDKMLLLRLARASNTNSVHCKHSNIFCAFNKKDEILLLLFNGSAL